MKNQFTLSLVAMVVLGFVITGFAAIQNSTPVSTVESPVSKSATVFGYARLIIDENDNATWHDGVMNRLPQTYSVDALYRRLGGSSRANVVNLLNEIGNDGWELVTTDEATYTFKRRK